MAVKVKIQKKQPTLRPEDYADAGDRSSRQTAYLSFAIIVVLLLGIAGMFVAQALEKGDPGKWVAAGAIFAWVVVPWWAYFVTLPRRYRVRVGLKNRVMPTYHPEIRDLVAQQCRILGIREPEVFVIEGENGWIQTLSGGRPYIVFTKPLMTILKPPEFACVMLRELGRIKSGHARAASLRYFLDRTPRFVRGIFAMPVWFLGLLLWQSWEDAAEVTLDRLTLVLTRDPRLCASTILKMQIETDPVMNVSPEDVEDYLKQHDPLKASSLEVSAHFKMGTTVHQNPELYERLKSFVQFTQSQEYKDLVEKVREVLSATKAGNRK